MATDNTNESAGILPRKPARKAYATFFMEDNTTIRVRVPVKSPLAGNRYSAYYNGPIVGPIVEVTEADDVKEKS